MTRLAQDPGIDSRQGLGALRGNQEKWVSLLRSMVTSHRNDISKLETCLQRGARDEARLIAHTLKGVAATLGAKGLSNAAKALEYCIRNATEAAPCESANLAAEVNAELKRLAEILGGSR